VKNFSASPQLSDALDLRAIDFRKLKKWIAKIYHANTIFP
jgi:hypothetical protein